MSGLYPIIRRIRRPLLPIDPPAESKPATVNAENESRPVVTDTSAEVADEKKTDADDSNK